MDNQELKIAQLSAKQANSAERQIKHISKGKATDSEKDAIYGKESKFINLEIQNEADQNKHISDLQSSQKADGKEYGSTMIIEFGKDKATLQFGDNVQGTSENISFKLYGSYENLKDKNGNTVVGTVHSHNHDRGLSGQGMDEQQGKGDMGMVEATKIPWYTVGPTTNHVGYVDPYGRVNHQIFKGTNMLLDALNKRK